MKNFISLRIVTLALVAGYMLKPTGVDADVAFLGVASGDATTNDVVVWTRAKDEANPQPTAINVQISQDPRFITGVTTLPAGTAGSPTDYTVKSNVSGLEPGTVYYYRFQTTNASVTSNVGKFKTAPNSTANAPVRFGFSGDCDGLIRPYAQARCRRRTWISSCLMETRNMRPLQVSDHRPCTAREHSRSHGDRSNGDSVAVI